MLVALTKPIAKLTDKQLVARMYRILKYFKDYSSSDPFGWDWPTMNQIFPELCAEYRELRTDGIRRLDQNNGILDGLQYTKNAKGNWTFA